MGIAIAVIVYGLLRYWGLPGWGASLAALPTLFDAREIALESYILPDTVFCLVILIAVALLLTRRTPRPWQCAAAGLLMAYATILRGNGIPLVVIVAAFMLIRRVGWRALGAAAVAFAVPVAGYVLAVPRPVRASTTSPPATASSCGPGPPASPTAPSSSRPRTCGRCARTGRSPSACRADAAWSISRLLSERTPADYLWASDAWWRIDAHPGINPANNKLGERLRARRDHGPAAGLPAGGRPRCAADLRRPPTGPRAAPTDLHRAAPHPRAALATTATTSGPTRAPRATRHAVYPYAFFVFLYQQPVIFPGLLFLLVLLSGLAGVVAPGGAGAAWPPCPGPWPRSASCQPALLTQSLYRYVIVAVPLACLAAGLAFADLRPSQARHTRRGRRPTGQPRRRPQPARPLPVGPAAAHYRPRQPTDHSSPGSSLHPHPPTRKRRSPGRKPGAS